MSTIYQLTTLPKGVLENAVKDGAIHPEMTRADVQALKLPKDKPPLEGIDLFRRNVRRMMKVVDAGEEKEQRYVYNRLKERFGGNTKAQKL